MKPWTEVTEANFEAEVLKSNRPVLVDFATEWSFSSTMLDGTLDELAVELADCLKVGYVKLDRNPNLGLWYGVRCIPTMLCFVEGEERVGIFGTTSKEVILSQLRPVISSLRAAEPTSLSNEQLLSLKTVQ
jgi:thioredoxin 1